MLGFGNVHKWLMFILSVRMAIYTEKNVFLCIIKRLLPIQSNKNKHRVLSQRNICEKSNDLDNTLRWHQTTRVFANHS